jgi:flagellar hook-basal body complex protein FliE
MNPINAVPAYSLSPVERPEVLLQPRGIGLGASRPVPPTDSFGKLFEGILGTVVAKDEVADTATRSLLMGDSSQLHQAVIAGAESDVAFTMMVEVRNKLLESYQELMRMQA